MPERLESLIAAEGLTIQAIIDRAQERFAPLWYPQFFRTATPSVSLDFTTIIGRSRVEAMASIISRESEFPLRGRAGVEKLQGEVPAIAVMRKMTAQEFRDLAMLRALPNISDQARFNAILDMAFSDLNYCRNSVEKRLDAMCLQAVSTGYVTIDNTNNPDGVAFTVPLLLDPTHRTNPVKVWTDITADIIADVETIVLKAQDDGRAIDSIKISRSLWRLIAKNTSVQNYVKAYNNPGSNAKYAQTLENVNEALVSNQLPVFEIVDQNSAIEKDGLLSPFRAWNQNNAVFVPNGELGIIHNSLADEQITAIPNVQYATSGNVLLSRWYQHKPLGEFTSGEYNAFPGLEAIDSIYILETNVAAG